VTELKVPVPPVEEQKRIVEEIEQINFESLQHSVKTTKELIEEYREAVLSSAFQGNL